MNTRRTFSLTDIPITDLELSSVRRQRTKVQPTPPQKISSISSSSIKTELHSSTTSHPPLISSDSPLSTHLLPIMSDTDEDLELEEFQRKQVQLETKYLAKIPVFKSPHETNIHLFLSTAEDIFSKLKYPDAVRLQQIRLKLDDSLHQWFIQFTSNGNVTWSDFTNALPNCLQTTSVKELSKDDKLHVFRTLEPNEKSSLLDVLRQFIPQFSGDTDARQWFF